jgi:hypothetical protein
LHPFTESVDVAMVFEIGDLFGEQAADDVQSGCMLHGRPLEYR